MLKIENVDIHGWEAAIRGMRNPMNSWEKSDSIFAEDGEYYDICGNSGPCNVTIPDADSWSGFSLGPNDHKLMMSLRNAGTDHRKFMRMIEVWLDITAPLYWWKEFDTYKVGTVANSCSTMHKIHAREFTMDDFSTDHLFTERDGVDKACCFDGEYTYTSQGIIEYVLIPVLNHYRKKYLETKDKDYWWQMIQLLPTSYNQRRTVMLSYEVLANIYKSRRNHKLDEWHVICDWIENLPYSELITGEMEEKEKENV